MNLSSLVGVDRLGRGEGGGGTTSSPSTPHLAGRRTAHVGITGSAVSSSSSSTTSPGVGGAVADLTTCLSGSPELGTHQVPTIQTPQPRQEIPTRHDSVDFSAFAFDPTPPREAPVVSSATSSHLPRERITRQVSKTQDYISTPWGNGDPTVAEHPSDRGAGFERRADHSSVGYAKDTPFRFRQRSQDQNYYQQHQQQAYSARAEFLGSSTGDDFGGANRVGRSWDDITRQRGKGNVRLDSEASSVRAPEQAMSRHWEPGANRGLVQRGGGQIGEECAMPLPLTANASVSSEASSFFEKRGVENLGGFFDRRGVVKPQGRHGDFSRDTAAPTLPTAQTQSTPLQPSSASSWGQNDHLRRNSYDIPRNSYLGPSPSRGIGSEGFVERGNRIATPLPKRPNTSYLSMTSTSNGVPISSAGGATSGRDGVKGVSVSLRAQDSVNNHEHSAGSGVLVATSAQAAMDDHPMVLAAGHTEANGCRRGIVGAMVSNTLEKENRAMPKVAEAAGSGHEKTQSHGTWFNKPFITNGSEFSWTSGFGDKSERYAETEGSQTILEPIRPATPPQITSTEVPSGKDDGARSGFGERGNNDDVFQGPDGEGGGGEVAKKLVFHEIFD